MTEENHINLLETKFKTDLQNKTQEGLGKKITEENHINLLETKFETDLQNKTQRGLGTRWGDFFKFT
jgi:hypothetical protein